jgi:hypothetical protein
MAIEKTITLMPAEAPAPIKRHSRAQMAAAFGIAAVSDVFSIWLTFAPPFQWALDVATAFALFLILGKRWALLPGLVMEAIPGMGVFPVWVLVVVSIIVYDGIKKPARAWFVFSLTILVARASACGGWLLQGLTPAAWRPRHSTPTTLLPAKNETSMLS